MWDPSPLHGRSPDELYDHVELHQQIKSLFKYLKPEERFVLSMRFEHGLSLQMTQLVFNKRARTSYPLRLIRKLELTGIRRLRNRKQFLLPFFRDE